MKSNHEGVLLRAGDVQSVRHDGRRARSGRAHSVAITVTAILAVGALVTLLVQRHPPSHRTRIEPKSNPMHQVGIIPGDVAPPISLKRTGARPISKLQAANLALIEEATAIVDHMITEYPTNPVPLVLMGRLQFRFGNTRQAVRYFRAAIELVPDAAEPYYRLGLAADANADYESAVTFYRQALARNPSSVATLEKLSADLLNLGKTQEVVDLVTANAPVSNGSVRCLVALGQSYIKLKQYENAKAVLQRAVELNPRYPEAYYALATAYSRLGQRDGVRACRKAFTEAEKEDLDYGTMSLKNYDDLNTTRVIVANVLTDAGMIYFQFKDSSKAEQLWLRAAALNPNHVVCRQLLVSLYRQEGRTSQAAALIEELHKIEQSQPPPTALAPR